MNIAMVASIIVGAVIMGIQLGRLKGTIERVETAWSRLEEIPVLVNRIGTIEKLISDYPKTKEKLAKIEGERKGESRGNTGRFAIPPSESPGENE